MGIEDLTELEIVSGILGLIALAISLIVGITIVSRYFKFKRHELLTVGFMMIFISAGWWPFLLSFVLFVLYDFYFPTIPYLILSYSLNPISHLLWIYSYGYLVLSRDSKWKFFSIFAAIVVLYELYLWYFLITDPSIIATREALLVFTNVSPVLQLFTIYTLVVSLITIFIFARKSMKSANPKIQWRGKFILYSMITFAASIILGILITVTGTTVDDITLFIVVNLMLYLSTILSYIGWIMPERISKWLIKES